MQVTGERYTQARTALAARRETGDLAVSDRTHSLLGQPAGVELAAVSRIHLERLPEPERRAAASGRSTLSPRWPQPTPA
jgi:hypothetical protein